MPTKERRLKEKAKVEDIKLPAGWGKLTPAEELPDCGCEVSREEMLEKENFRLRDLLLNKPIAHEQDRKPTQKTLIAFESGHYKAFTGSWLGDSVWGHHRTVQGKTIHINKDKVEYIETE